MGKATAVLQWADKQLGTAQTWAAFEKATEDLSACHDDVLNAKQAHRTAKDLATEREIEIMTETRGRSDIGSNAQYESELKAALASDAKLKALRSAVGDAQHALAGCEHSVSEAEYTIRGLIAKMEQNAGVARLIAASGPGS